LREKLSTICNNKPKTPKNKKEKTHKTKKQKNHKTINQKNIKPKTKKNKKQKPIKPKTKKKNNMVVFDYFIHSLYTVLQTISLTSAGHRYSKIPSCIHETQLYLS